MGRTCWNASTDGWYAIDIRLDRFAEMLRIDTGIADWRHEAGFDLDSALWDRLFYAGAFNRFRRRLNRDASGRERMQDSGQLTAQLLDPFTKLPIGPAVTVFALRGTRGVPSRVGVEFFHRLTGCSVNWDLDAKSWCVAYP